MRAVNLLPSDVQQLRGGDSRLPLLLGAGGLAAVTLATVSLWLAASSAVGEKEDELASIEAAIAAIPTDQGRNLAQAALVRERSDRVEAFEKAIVGRVAFDELLRDVSLVLPGGVWLTGITASAPEPETKPAGATTRTATPDQTVTIQGAAFTYRDVARSLVRLAATPSLTNVRLDSTERVVPLPPSSTDGKKAPRQKPYVTFSIVASVSTEEAGS